MRQLARIVVESHGEDVVVARIEGEVDMSNAPAIGNRLRELLTNRSVALIVDLGPTSYLDSSGVALLFALFDELRAAPAAAAPRGARGIAPGSRAPDHRARARGAHVRDARRSAPGRRLSAPIVVIRTSHHRPCAPVAHRSNRHQALNGVRLVERNGPVLTFSKRGLDECRDKNSATATIFAPVADGTGIQGKRLSALAHPIRLHILSVAESEDISASEVAVALSEPLGVVAYHFRVLHTAGLIELVGTERRRGSIQSFYRATTTGWSDLAETVEQLIGD